MKMFGFSRDWEKYTLCEFIYSQFALFAVSLRVLINVLDPEKHKETSAPANFPITNGEAMVYGATQFDSSTPDGSVDPWGTFMMYSVSCKQLNLFRHRPDLISNRQWYWLRNVVSAACFARVGSSGSCNYTNASGSGGGVRPAALIY